MLPVSLFWLPLWASGTASACDGKSAADCTAAAHADATHTATAHAATAPAERQAQAKTARTQPGNCARQGELVGLENCAWTTSLMAQRVLADGAPYTYVGGLSPSSRVLPSKVAAPFTMGPGGAMFVIANEVLDTLDPTAARVELTGKVLEVEGIVYFVATGAVPLDS